MKEFIEDIKTLVASHFALYLKTQSYHWHVKGPHFLSLHKLFEEQYRELFESLDDLAEKLVMLGETVPSSLGELNDRNLCEPANIEFSDNEMLKDLKKDHEQIMSHLKKVCDQASKLDYKTLEDIMVQRINAHEKHKWFLSSMEAGMI